MSKRLSKTMLTTLRKLRDGPKTAERLGCSINTLIALEQRKMVRVETSFNAIAFPRKALAYITEAGRVAGFQIGSSRDQSFVRKAD